MPQSVVVFRVFLATPGGLEEERRAFRSVLNEYNETEALEHGVMFQPVGWEITVPGVGRPQALINQDLRTCDHFVLALCDRWGSPPDTEGRYSSGSEEEYTLALSCYRDPALPMRQIAAFFKAVPPERLNDPDPQLQKVLGFKKELDERKQMLFAMFDDVEMFRQHLRRLLARWRRDYQRPADRPAGRQPLLGAGPVTLSLESVSLMEARPAGSLVIEAERLANEGRLTDAEALFARAILQGAGVVPLSHYGRFLVRVGRLSQAEVIYEQILRVAGPGDERWQAETYGNLGLINRTRGRFSLAVEFVQKALEIDERTNRADDMAIHYGHLGLIYRTLGDLTRAEEMNRRALDIEQAAGRLEGMAVQYGNLGVVYQMRGDLELAESMQREALKIEQRLDRQEGIASAYGNLGSILTQRGQLDEAEPLLQKALDLDRRLGRLEGMANHYDHLGALYRRRKDAARADEMLNRALEINEQLGRLKGQADNYSELALLRSMTGDHEGAERFLRKALGLDEQLGRLQGMARRYEMLADLYELRGERAPARALSEKAKELYGQIHVGFVDRSARET